MMFRWRSLAALATMALAIAGCSRKEEQASAPAPAPAPVAAARKETRIIVPAAVAGQWKAVKIAVLDKEKNREEIYTVDLGRAFPLPGSGISLQADNFLPAFIMDGTTLTSVSNEPKNPAVRIIVREGGREIFKGWLFSLYPGTHAFQHPRYSFTLVGYLPAKGG